MLDHCVANKEIARARKYHKMAIRNAQFMAGKKERHQVDGVLANPL
jgi:hypothetical protein